MANVVVMGAQWGDEGKGKIVDWLSERADIVVRFQGGHNAGHTLVIGNQTYKLALLPSGVVRPGKLSVIGNGVVLDPWHLVSEIDGLRQRGIHIDPQSLKIAENATLILPLHRELDQLRETAAAEQRIGTTGRGIGPAYEDKVGRRAIRAQDLKNLGTLGPKVDRLLVHHNALRRGLGVAEIGKDVLMRELTEIAPKILPFVDVVWSLLDRERRAGKRILFEGAQGALLDVDHGTYPFVTSSNTVAAQAATGSGMGPGAISYVLGLAKAYTTRVGSGPFPTELTDDIGERLGERGQEFGVNTGRKRRCGWFDACLVRQVIKVSGIDGIALTKLDVLDGFPEIKVCIAYELDGAAHRQPARRHQRAGARQADLRELRGLVAVDARRAHLGAAAGAGGEIRAPHRGADRVPGDPALDQPRARRHHSGEGPVRGLSLPPVRVGHLRSAIRGDEAGKSGERARGQLRGEQPIRIDWARQRDLAARNGAEAEPGVVGLIADQYDQGDAGAARGLERSGDEPAAVALVGERGIDGERSQQQCAALAADQDRREAHGGGELSIDPAHPAEGRELRGALAQAVGGARKASRPEGARVQGADVRAVFG